jgi:hypothetical protein
VARDGEITNLEQLLERIEAAAERHDSVSLGDVLAMIGERSFGPLLLLAGLITLAPVIGDIPGVPTLIGLFLFLIAVQLLFGRSHFWLPRWLRARSLGREKLGKTLGWLKRPAQYVDRLLRPRLTLLVTGPAVYVIAAACVLIAAALPVMEVVPFSANIAGGALTAFGLALIARDGLFALIAFALTAVGAGAVVYGLL